MCDKVFQDKTKVKTQGIDSYTGKIAIDEKDTISFDLGMWSNSLTEEQPVIWERSSLPENFVVDTTRIVLVDDSRGIDPDKYRKQTFTWDTLDGREAKIVYPRESGKGITGVYIDSLWTRKLEIVRFNLYGRDLSPENELEFLKVLKTLRFQEQQ